ncbi:uncharacterized protein PRCAT00002360001 [Priceomyces carsonii]|uniref:uncharacterized protein n=1 Tax=Priceomyces carsonii TaxID=28549 RepID=UPI002ED816B9|nr:unnamed protein product [Priceomyces carsonii]
MVSASESRLSDLIKIDDITSGKVHPNQIYDELERLKVEINILRNDMSLFLKALATIPPNQSQLGYYKVVSERLDALKASIKDYCDQYNKLLPIINLAQIKLGNEVEVAPNSQSMRLSNESNASGLNKISLEEENGKLVSDKKIK